MNRCCLASQLPASHLLAPGLLVASSAAMSSLSTDNPMWLVADDTGGCGSVRAGGGAGAGHADPGTELLLPGQG